MELAALLQSLTPQELRFIAEADYGEDAEQHLQALQRVVENGGRLHKDQRWFPYEVIELRAHAYQPGHEREFVACTLVVLAAVASGYDTWTELDLKFESRAQDYDALEPQYREPILLAYVAAGL